MSFYVMHSMAKLYMHVISKKRRFIHRPSANQVPICGMSDACCACLFLDFSCSSCKVVAVRFQVRYFSEEDIRSNSRQALIVCEIHL